MPNRRRLGMAGSLGKIIEFLDGDRLRLAVVTAVSPEHLHVTDSGGRQHRIGEKQVVVVHPRSARPADVSGHAAQLLGEIEALEREVDTELLWEHVRDDGGELELAALAASYFGSVDSLRQSAVFRAVARDEVRFRRRGKALFARGEHEVAAKLNALRNREERESRRRSACAWMARALVSPGTAEPPPDLAELARRLETYLWQPSQRGGEVEEWLRDVAADLDPADTAYRVLRGAGRLPQDADRFLATAGIREEFPPRALEACESLAPFAPEASREDFTSLLTFSIDDPGTAEVDDALSVEAVPDGGARIGIHIADVAAFVDVGGVLDLEAFRRGTSIYLPSRTVTMLPRRLACGLASLERGELRPSLSFVADIDAGGAVRGVRIARGMVRVWERLDYRAVDALLRERRSDPLAVALARLDFLSASLLAGRRARGALVLRRPELRVRARPGEPLEVEVLDAESAGRRIVTELMILANRAAAEWARSFGIAIIYRAQDPPREPIVVPEVYDPVALDEVFRRLSRSAFSTHPRPHGGLGLECYTQTTSPIRRYADLVIQRQLAAHLDGRPLPYGVEELLRVLAASQDAEVEARRVEERATRFHLLEHLQATRCADELEGVLVRRQGSSGIVETTDLYVRGTLLGAGGFSPGHRLRLRIERIDPERDVLVFRAVG